MSRTGSRVMSRPTVPDRPFREEEESQGVKQVKESEIGRCVSTHHQFLPSFLRSNPIKSVYFSATNHSLKWSDGGRFHLYDIGTSNISRTPWNRLRRTVNCMIAETINSQEYIWTGHTTSEVALWNEAGRLVGKPFHVGKTAITALCLVRPTLVWVGTQSGNIRCVKVHTELSPFEIRLHTQIVPNLAMVNHPMASVTRPWAVHMRIRPKLTLTDNIPEEVEATPAPERSRPSMVHAMRSAAEILTTKHRAHTSNVRCIFTKGTRVWTSGGHMFSSIKVWSLNDNHLEDTYLCHARGPCSAMASIPWHSNEAGGGRSSDGDWRLLSAHESGVLLLWDPAKTTSFHPLLEIETRKSPIRSVVVFESLGLMCTAHKDGSVLFGRLVSPSTRIYGFSSSATQTEMEDDGEIYPFVPRTICEDVFACGLQCALGGSDFLFTVSNRGAILHWTRERLESHLKVLRQSSNRRRMPIERINESVMVISQSQVEVGETIYDGDFARVKKGKFLAMDVIVKEAKDEADARRAMDAIVKDAHILSNVRHPNIVNIMAVCDDPPFVVMQYYEEGSLYDVLKRCRTNEGRLTKRFTWEKRLSVAIDVGCGMVFLHSQHPAIIHRDLKSPNVFIEKEFNGASVGDFNLSKDPGIALNNHPGTSVRPSNPMWIAPEIAKGDSDFTVATDLYSFGIILWELLTDRPPWDHLRRNMNMSRDNFFSKIRYELLVNNGRPEIKRDKEGKLVCVNGAHFPQAEAYVRVMQECWADNPEDRPKSFQVVVTKLERIRRELRESRSRPSQNSSNGGDGGRQASGTDSDKPDSKDKSEKIRDPSKETKPIVDRVSQTLNRRGSLPPRSPSNLKEQDSVGLPPSPFDHNTTAATAKKDKTKLDEEENPDKLRNQPSMAAPCLPLSPFEVPSQESQQQQDEEEPLPSASNSPFDIKTPETKASAP